MNKRDASPDAPQIASKRARAHTPPRAPTLDSWLKPGAVAPLLASSPHLHASSSTFISFTLSFVPPAHVRSPAALTKEAKRVVRELDVVRLVGGELLERNDGAFQNGEGRAPSRGKGKERAREPDHRMWAVRTLGLVEGKDGTGGAEDYQLLEAFDDDGEKYGGERVLRVLKDQGAVDVLTICCRWFGGDMLGPSRFHHIGITAQHSATELLALVARRDLRAELARLDKDIDGMRTTLAAAAGAASSQPQSQPQPSASAAKYDDIDDVARLERLVAAKEKTRSNLESRVGWAAMDQAGAEM